MTHSHTHSERLPFSKALVLGMVGMVFVINVLILAYAVRTAMPVDDVATVTPASLRANTTSNPGEATDLAANVPIVVANIALPSQTEVEALFTQHCAACHGADGRGRGPAAEQLYPKPRDFVASPFRFASTTGERDEVVAALERTISQGVPRSAMPGFAGVLSESQIAGLARHVLELRGDKSAVASAELHIDIGRHPPLTPALAERGRELYTSLGCVTCHGESGHGDGLGSKGLFDSTNRPVKPGDLASGLYKSGQTPESIARTILAGVPGTPMTPYEQMLIKTTQDGVKDATEVWALVAFIQGLSPRPQPPGIASGANLRVHDAPDHGMLDDPAHVAWLGVPETLISLRPLWQREEQTTTIGVRAVHTSDRIALCLDWEDESLDVVRDISAFPDGVAVMFALSDEAPALPMGVEMEGHEPRAPVNIWHWRADRQFDAITGDRHAASDFNSTENGNRWYLFSRSPAARLPRLVDSSAMTFETEAQDAQFITAAAVGNELALESLTARAVLEANALGFGTLTLQHEDSQATDGTAAWSERAWRVLMTRSRETADSLDVNFNAQSRIPVAFAVWDGSKHDRAGVKLITGWHWLDLSLSLP